MIGNDGNTINSRSSYREMVQNIGKKEFTLIKMQEYGFWPDKLPTPYERQKNETKQDYEDRKKLLDEYNKIINEINDLYKEKGEINKKLRELQKRYDSTWDYEKIRKDVAQEIMRESKEKRTERKRQKEEERIKRSEEWNIKKDENIIFIGKGYSNLLHDKETDVEKLGNKGLPIINTDKELADFLGIEYKQLRFLVYHRDVVNVDHYHRYSIPKKKGGVRNIAAPKPVLKKVQRSILEEILYKIEVADNAHGFIKEKSVISAAKTHINKPELLINIDLQDFFPTVTFERIRGMFKSFGYSGYISSLLAMLCTYCERMPLEIKGEIKYIATTKRILPQGSAASPMITNILCRTLDKRLSGLAKKYDFTYTRYADDMSFSLNNSNIDINKLLGLINKVIKDEGFNINRDKTRFLRKNNRQCITGIVINNDEIGVPKKWVKILRAAIHNANKMKNNKENIAEKTINEISGMSAWLKAVNKEKYKKIIEDAEKILK